MDNYKNKTTDRSERGQALIAGLVSFFVFTICPIFGTGSMLKCEVNGGEEKEPNSKGGESHQTLNLYLEASDKPSHSFNHCHLCSRQFGYLDKKENPLTSQKQACYQQACFFFCYPKIKYMAAFTLCSRKLRIPLGMNAARIVMQPAMIPRIRYFTKNTSPDQSRLQSFRIIKKKEMKIPKRNRARKKRKTATS